MCIFQEIVEARPGPADLGTFAKDLLGIDKGKY